MSRVAWMWIVAGTTAGAGALALVGVASPPAYRLPPGDGVLAHQPADQPTRPTVAPAEAPPLADQVVALLDAPYLSDAERRDRRVFHGVWEDGDLDTPARRAAAALVRGAFDDPSLSDGSAPVEDRAEAAIARGELEEALTLLGDGASLRAVRLRAESLDMLGRTPEAIDALTPLVDRLRGGRIDAAPDLVEAVRGMMLRSAIAGTQGSGGQDYRAMLALLSRARTELDRLYWPAHLAEAELLASKDQRREATQAALETLTLNPSCAAAWALLGRAAVDSFNIDAAEKVAARLDALAPDSARAAAILARARLRQSDAPGALALLAPALERLPNSRMLLALRAASAAQAYEYARADAELGALDALSPGHYEGYFEVGRTLSEARQYEPSSRYLTEAARRAPFRADPVIELGLMMMQAGRDADANGTLTKAVALDPFNLRAGNSLKLVTDLLTFPTIDSEHFVIRYRPGVDGVLAAEMPALLEGMHERVTGGGPGGIDHEPAGRTLIDLLPDHRAFAVRIAGITRIHTMAAATGPLIAMESPREGGGQSVGAYDWLRVLRHEYTHTVTLSRTNNRIPHWFTEAAAVYMEDAPRDGSICRLLDDALSNGGLFDLDGINLAFVRPKRPQDRGLAYAQGHWMYEFIVRRWGERAPLDMMDRYAGGEREPAAMRTVLGLPPDEFVDQFKAWAREQVLAWGMGRPAGEPSIRQLLTEEAAAEDRAALESRLTEFADDAGWGLTTGGRSRAAWEPELPDPTPEMAARWLEQHPNNADVLELSVRLRLRQSGGEPTEAVAPLLERYAAARPVDELPHKLLAKLYLASAETAERAIPHLEFLDAREQKSAAYAGELARRYAALGQWDKAGEKARRATIISPFDADQRELAATVALTVKDYESAERHITALTRLEPDREVHQRRLEAVRRMREQSGASISR